MTVGAVPVVLGAVGFTGAGITASSLAAKMMSVSAIANGGGVAAGSLVATLQSVGKCPWWGKKDKGLRRSSLALAQRASVSVPVSHPQGPLTAGRREPWPGPCGLRGLCPKGLLSYLERLHPTEGSAPPRSQGDPGAHPLGELAAAAHPE